MVCLRPDSLRSERRQIARIVSEQAAQSVCVVAGAGKERPKGSWKMSQREQLGVPATEPLGVAVSAGGGEL